MEEWYVHGVVERLGFDGLEPELLGLLLREAARREPGPRRRLELRKNLKKRDFDFGGRQENVECKTIANTQQVWENVLFN